MESVTHTVEVTAATLYEAVAQGLNVLKVLAADVRVEHEVRLMEFTKWLERDGGSPREASDRKRILGMSAPPHETRRPFPWPK